VGRGAGEEGCSERKDKPGNNTARRNRTTPATGQGKENHGNGTAGNTLATEQGKENPGSKNMEKTTPTTKHGTESTGNRTEKGKAWQEKPATAPQDKTRNPRH
jgi:hypothetical protein